MLLFAIGVVYVKFDQDRKTAFERVTETVRGIRLVLDSEITAITAGLDVLALTQALQREDIGSFRQNAMAFVSQYRGDAALVLADREGHQLLNTRVAAGESLPTRQYQAGTDAIFRTGRPAYSRLFIGSVSGKPIITIDVPVVRDGAIAYVLSFNPPMSMFQRIVEQRRLNDQWTVSIFDQDGINFARVPNPEQTIGQRASPSLYAELFKSSEANIDTVSLEGVPLLTAFTRSQLTGWTVAAGISRWSVTAPLWRTLAITAAIGLALLAIGLFFAVGLAARIVRAEALHDFLVHELNHRVKNTLATVQSIAMQTFRGNTDTAEAQRKFSERIMALGEAHGLLGQENWVGADVRGIVQRIMEPYALDAGRIRFFGPEIHLPSARALMISMILHELATNAIKYGALSNATGTVLIEWRRSGDEFSMTWREQGGPPVQQPTRTGFGTRLITQGLGGDGSAAAMTYDEAGLTCTINCPLNAA